MVDRPTIRDLAEAAGVSVSTVNRVIGGAETVRAPTQDRVLRAAERIGFYGVGSIQHAIRAQQETHRIGILLQQGGRAFYRNLGDALRRAADAHSGGKILLEIDFLDDLSPDTVAQRLLALGQTNEAVALVAAEHPLVSDAIDRLITRGVAVIGLIAQLSARGNVGYVGLDHWKVGRTAAWFFDKVCRTPGDIGILLGNHRYRNQELNESGFRSYFRENNSAFRLLEPRATYESQAVGREMTEQLLAENPDMCGLFVSGGGITGALAALRSQPRRDGFVAVGYELMEVTRAALIDGTLTAVISHPIDRLATETIAALVRAKSALDAAGAITVNLNFEIYTAENI